MRSLTSLCPDSADGKHRWVRLFSGPPEVGCLNCRQPVKMVRPTGQELYHLLVDKGVPGREAARRSGLPPSAFRGRKPNMRGAQAAERGSPEPAAG